MLGLCLENSICLASLIGGPTEDSDGAGPFLWERWAVRARVVGQKYQPGWIKIPKKVKKVSIGLPERACL